MKQNLLFNRANAFGMRFIMVLTMLLIVGVGSVWGADYSKNESWAFTTSGNTNWSGHNSGYCGACGSKSAAFNVYKTDISNFENIDFSKYENVSLTIYVKAGTNGGTNSYTVKLIDANGNQVSTYASTKNNGMGNGTNSSSAKESSVSFNPTTSFNGYKIEFPVKAFITQTRYVLTYDDKIASYTVTWTINPTAGGSLSATSGNSTIVSPNAAYTYGAPAYTVTSGKATVSQRGNTFTATPTEDCTIQINMEEKPKCTVNWYVNGSKEYSQTDVAGTALTNIPNLEDYECEDKVFVGWTTQSSYEHATNAPTDLITNTTGMTIPENGEDYYAVFARETSTTTNKTLTLNSTNLSSAMGGSYSSTDFSYSGISFGRSNAAIMSGTIQIKAGTSNAVWNKTELPGAITSITVTKKTNNSTLTVGISTKPTTNSKTVSSTTTYTFDVNSNYRYFKIAATSSYTQVTSVVITYSATSSSYSDYTTSCTTETVVTLNPNGGTFATDPEGWTKDGDDYKKEGVTGAIDLPTPTRKGYNFDGWYNGETKVNLPYAPSESVTLVAKWIAKQTQLSINANTANHGYGSGFSVVATYGEALPNFDPCTPAIGYTLNGYYTAATGGTKIIDIDGKLVSNVSDYTSADGKWASEAEQLILYAQYIINTYTVKFDNQGHGTKPDDQTINYGGKVNNPGNLTANGFIFGGWYREAGCINAWDFANDLVTSNITLYAKWTAKTATSLSWSADTYSATIDADNDFPTLTKSPADLSPIAYSSSHTDVATIDANGNITLVAAGTTTITATFTETDTHTSATDAYTLTVHPSNCRWVEVTDNTTLEGGDEVVIAMEYNGFLYALPNDGGDKTPVLVHVTEADILSDGASENLIWDIEKETIYLIFHPNNSTDNLFFNKQDDGVRIGSTQTNAKVNHKFVISNNHLANIGTSRYLGIGIVNGEQKWKTYTITTGNLADQTLKFYKRECLDASKVWVEGNLTNVTCTPQLPQQLAKDGSITLTFSPVTAEYTLPTNVSVKMGSTTLTPSWNRTTGELTINAPTGGFTDNVLVTVEAVELHTITWMVGSNSVKSEKVENGNPITLTPDNPANNAIGECADTFMGWTETPLGSAEGQSAPADLCTAAQMKAKYPSVNGDKTFYAVFATKGSGGIAQGTVLWAENFEHFGTKKPSEAGTGTGTTIYGDASITYSQSSKNTKGYNDEAYAGGTLPELLLYKGGTHTWTIAGIPTGGATQMELSFLSNRTEFNVTSSTTGITINGSETAWNIEADSDVTNFTLTIKNTSVKNARLDNVSVVVAEGGVSYSNYVTNCCNTPAPTNGAYTSVSGTEIKLTWDDAANTNRYHITGGNLSAEGVYVTNKYYNITGLTECEEYTFNVSAYPEDGCESEAITITAQPFSGAKTVTFNYNGNGQTNTTTSTSCNNKSITLPTPVWAGYRFMGWFTAESGGAEIDDNPYTPTEDITLFAHWEKEYTVTYDLQGGTASPVCSGDKYIAGETVIICTSTPVKSGYRFIGWTYAPDVTITNGQFTMPESNVTITAEFVARVVTNIEVATNTHRVLMQGSTFIGEQIRVTYDNGETETLDWGDTRLTFSGYNMATLGTYTVCVDYNDCGTANTSYSIEVIDGIAITFIDAGISETIKYELNAHVDVETKTGQYACSGYEFVGWSETEFPLSDVPNMRTSEEYVPVRNFNATTSRTLYAVYSILKKQGWVSIEDANHIRSGAEYMIVKNRYDTYSALSTTTSTYNANYRAATILDKDEDDNTGNMIVWRRTSDNTDFQIYTGTATNYVKWLLIKKDNKNYLYNQTEKKYLQVTTTAITLTSEMADNFKITNESGDCCLNIQSATSNYYISGYNSSNNYYFQPYSTETDANYLLTRDSLFTTTPPCSPLFATFYGNGGIVTDGIKSGDYLTIKEPTRDAGITTPTASFADCNGKSWTFVGWSREEIDVTRVPVLTTDLLHDGGGNEHYYIQEDGEEFWAVYTNQATPETKYGTITFTKENFPNTYVNISKSCTIDENGDSYNFDYTNVAKPSGNSIQIQEGKGYLTNTTSLGKINSISFTNFIYGNINCLKVSLGTSADALTTVLTAEELQVVDGVYTYYPKANYSFFKIESIEDAGAVGITSISIDFGKGTQIWATTPDCSTITLSGDEIYVTATNGRAVMAPATLTVKANQLEANADVILTSNSSDVYFSTDRTFNFAAGQAADQKPTTSLTLPTDAEGNLATTDVYIHYMPSSEGDGVPANVIISANLETPNPSITDDHTIHVRNLPAKFVIATKVGATWYALPANMTGETNPLAEVIEVDETTMTATAPNTSTYTLWPVKTTNGTGNRYADYGDRLRFAAVNNEQRGLWANNNNNSSAIRNYAVINSLGADGLAAYEWKVTTTVVDGRWQYTLQTDQTQNQNYLRYWTSAEGTPVGPKWGTYNAGENKLYFLPVTETQPFEYAVVEWYPTKVLIQTDAAITSPTVKVGGEEVASSVFTSKGGTLYEISNLPLETNPTKLLQVSFTDDAINYTNTKVVPIILSRGAKTITGEPFATLTQKVYQYADVVVRDGATLTIDGTTDVANMLLGMTIYPTAKVSVAENKKLSVHSLTFFGGIDEIYNGSTYEINKYGVPQLSLKGILNKTITTMDYIMRVDLEQMYQVGVPYDVDLYDITYWDGTAMTLGDNLYVSAYDGQKRANLEPKSWVWETDFTEKVLKAGIGYTISAYKQDANHEYSIIRMPMKSNITSGSTETAKTVQVYAYNNKNGVEITDNNKGWNYLSNPYMAAISGKEADSKLVVGYLDRDDVAEPWRWVEDGYRYVTIPSDDGTYHYQQKFKDAILNPFKSFFLQIAAEGELSFDLASRQSAPARYLQTDNEKREVEFEVLLANDTRSDNLGFLIGEDYTPAYEINADLEKMIGSMSVYTIYNGYNLAYNALSPANAEEQIPIGYVVPTVGEYTWALDESSNIEDVEHIYLIDYETSAITDLVTDVYTFTASEQKSDTRFAINVTLKSKESTVTGLVNINKDSEQSLKFIHNDKIYILHNGVIYDATGKFVETINK